MQKVDITVIIPTKNEEKNLSFCLQPIYNWAQKIIVVDSGSTDGTHAIASKYNAEVVIFDYKGGWPKKRQHIIETYPFTTQWILLLDADEILDDKSKLSIENAIKRTEIDGFYIWFRLEFLGRMLKRSAPGLRKMSLFRTGKGNYERRFGAQDNTMGDMEVHEHVVVNGRVTELDTPVLHRNYNNFSRFIIKHDEYSNYEAKVHTQGEKTAIEEKFFGTPEQRRRYLKKKFIRNRLSPIGYFFYLYILKLGFLDGKAGFYYSIYQAIYLYFVNSKVYEIEYLNKNTKNTTVNRKYQICTKTIMDTSDSNITFDKDGISDYYHNFKKTIEPNWHTDEQGYNELMRIAEKIRKECKNKEFDCIIGLSGGLDSSYTAYITKEVMGLRPLIFHVDAGWNTQQAVSNIEKLLNGLNLELYTEVINWEEMKDLQVAFLKAQIPDQDLPQDTAFFSTLYKFAVKHKVKYVFTGGNFSTECCREPEEWGAYLMDSTLIKDIHKKFGKKPLKSFPIVDTLIHKIYYNYILGMKVVKPLNYVPFVKKDAEKLLEEKFGWQKFQHKHHESRFTRFYEDYWMPKKFGYEKRRAHFSSLILTGQMTREEALERIAKPEMSEDFLKQEFEYVANKLDLSPQELQDIFEGENKTYRNYKNKKWIISLGTYVLRSLGVEKRLIR